MKAEAALIADFVFYGNALTAFCVLQAASYLHLVAGNPNARKLFLADKVRVVRIALAWGIIYTILVVACFASEMWLRSASEQSKSVLTFAAIPLVGRLFVIWSAQWTYRFGLSHPPSDERSSD